MVCRALRVLLFGRTSCTLPKRSSSISRMFFILACLFGAAHYLLSGGGGWVGWEHFFPLATLLWLCSILRISLISRHPPPDALLVTTGPTSLPLKKPKSPPPEKKGLLPHRRYVYVYVLLPLIFPFFPIYPNKDFFSLLSQTLEISKSFPLTNKTFFRSVI